GLGAKEWNNSLKTKLSLLPKKLFRIRMSRNFGMKMLTMTNLSTECLIQLTKLGYDATPFNQILKQNAKRESLQAAYANLHTDQERDYFMQRYHDVISSFGGKTSYDADNRPLLVMRSNLWASGYDVHG